MVGEKEDISTGTTQPKTEVGGKTMHAIVWHGNYDVRCVCVGGWAEEKSGARSL